MTKKELIAAINKAKEIRGYVSMTPDNGYYIKLAKRNVLAILKETNEDNFYARLNDDVLLPN